MKRSRWEQKNAISLSDSQILVFSKAYTATGLTRKVEDGVRRAGKASPREEATFLQDSVSTCSSDHNDNNPSQSRSTTLLPERIELKRMPSVWCNASL